MTETPTRKIKGSLYKPPSERPDDTNISLGQYIDDAKVRWQIHLYEWDEFTTDVIVPTAKSIYSWSVKTIDNVRQWQAEQVKTGTEDKPSQ
jgi:hypothetical protein